MRTTLALKSVILFEMNDLIVQFIDDFQWYNWIESWNVEFSMKKIWIIQFLNDTLYGYIWLFLFSEFFVMFNAANFNICWNFGNRFFWWFNLFCFLGCHSFLGCSLLLNFTAHFICQFCSGQYFTDFVASKPSFVPWFILKWVFRFKIDLIVL